MKYRIARGTESSARLAELSMDGGDPGLKGCGAKLSPAAEDGMVQGWEPRCKTYVLPSNYETKCLLKEQPVLT